MITAFKQFVDVLTEFTVSLLPLDLSEVIIAVIGIILGLAAWRIVS